MKTDLISKLAPMKGVEPPTCRLGGDRSILLSYMGLCSVILIHISGVVNMNICLLRPYIC